MKKFLIIALTLIILSGFCACSSGGYDEYVDYYEGDAEAEAAAEAEYYATFEYKDSYETEPQTNYYATTQYQSPSRPYITHVAIEGAVIVNQDGTADFSYYKKCEACGYTESNMRINTSGSYGKLTSGFYCPKCKNHQDIIIEHNSN